MAKAKKGKTSLPEKQYHKSFKLFNFKKYYRALSNKREMIDYIGLCGECHFFRPDLPADCPVCKGTITYIRRVDEKIKVKQYKSEYLDCLEKNVKAFFDKGKKKI